jgi:uncharacterized protein (TIRG00374 family)
LKEKLLTVAKIVITVALVAYSFSRVDLALVGAQLANTNLWLVLLALLVYLGAIALNGLKWWVLLRAQKVPVPLSAAVQYMFVGFFFNNLLPANIGGDVMRGYGMARYTDRTAEAAVSVVVDRMVGLFAYMGAAAVASIIVVTVTGRSELRVLVVAAVFALVVITAVLAILLSRRLHALIARLFQLPVLASLAPLFENVSAAFEAYRFRYRALLLAFLIALLGLMAANVANWLLFQAEGGGVSLLYICLFNPLIALVLLLPISIGGHGVIQNAYPFFYGLVGVPPTQALATSVLMSFLIILGSLPGAVFWLRNRRQSDEEIAAVAPSQP